MSAESCEEKIAKTLECGLTSMTILVGSVTGLFKAFEQNGGKCTSSQLAATAGLKERYVREWLGSMVAMEFVQINDKSEYELPFTSDFIDSLTNLGFLQMIVNRYERLLNCMKRDGPSGYEMGCFPDIGLFLKTQRKVPESIFYVEKNFIMQNISPVIDMICEKKEVTSNALRVMDLGCGSGHFSFELSKVFPEMEIIGIDEDDEVVQIAKNTAVKENVTNVTFKTQKGEDIGNDMDNSIDMVVLLDVLHDLADPEKVLASIKRVLKKNGYIIAFDPAIHSDHRGNVGNTVSGQFLTISMFVCLPNSLSREPAVGYGMGWGYENRKKFLEDQGFRVVTMENEDENEIKVRLVAQKM